jgi:hypothetical protein
MLIHNQAAGIKEIFGTQLIQNSRRYPGNIKYGTKNSGFSPLSQFHYKLVTADWNTPMSTSNTIFI